MAGTINRDDIAAVRERAPLEEIVRERVALKSGGVGALKGLCPFHDEKTPSFQVRPAAGALALLRMRRGRRRHRLHHEGRRPAVRGGRRVPRGSGRGDAAVRVRGHARAVRRGERSPAPARGASRRRGVLRRAAGYARGEDRARLPDGPRLRQGGGGALRRGVRAEGVVRAARAPARQGVHRAGDRGVGARVARRARPVRPVPRAAGVAHPRRHRRGHRLRRPQALRGRRRPQVPQHPRDADLQEVEGALRARPRQEGHRGDAYARSSSRDTPTSWRATWPA